MTMICLELIMDDTTIAGGYFKNLAEIKKKIKGVTFTHFLTDNEEVKNYLILQGYKFWVE